MKKQLKSLPVSCIILSIWACMKQADKGSCRERRARRRHTQRQKGMTNMKAYLILEDGSVLEGQCIGSARETVSEIVFNTSMTGYLEVLTDPSYAGQAVVMTYPLIGNYGICRADRESDRIWADGFIVRELSRIPSNFRSEDTIQHFLEQNDIPGISGVDTRTLTKLLREKGTMNGMITTTRYDDLDEPLRRIREYRVRGAVKRTSCAAKYVIDPSDPSEEPRSVRTARRPESLVARAGHGKRVALLDLGAKANIAESLVERGCRVGVYPCDTKAEEILADAPDGIMLSNGPGDPKENTEIIAQIRRFYDSDIPIFAICLGHQLMALATGADTFKLKYGHRGGNHPVKDLETGRVYITSQNHGYAVNAESLDPAVAVPAFVNVNDGTNEGLRYVGKKIITVQYHPEACPGPQDSGYLFDRFIEMMEVNADA